MSRVRDLANFNSRVMDMDGNATDTITADIITADTITADTVTFTSSGTPTITSPTSIILNADSGNGIINFSGSKVMNLGAPVNSQDAAPKSYVDTEVSGVESYVNSIIYTDLDVDAHLNTASATSGQVLSWNGTSLTWTTQSSGAAGIGNFTLAASVIDTDDSSGITITPAVTISSDLNVENDLRVTNIVYAETFESTATGAPTLTSASSINLSATDRVTINKSPLKFATFTSTERDALTSVAGDTLFNSTTTKLQVYTGSAWADLH